MNTLGDKACFGRGIAQLVQSVCQIFCILCPTCRRNKATGMIGVVMSVEEDPLYTVYKQLFYQFDSYGLKSCAVAEL